jgi:hypothetical protein
VKDIVLTKEQYEHLPYKNTTLDKDATFGEIVGLLRRHGIKKYFMDGDEDEFTFVLSVKHLDMERHFPVKISVPRLMYPKQTSRGSKRYVNTYLEKESWRVAWWYLKAKLDAITYGISDDFREFMPNIYSKLEDGREVNLSDIILNAKKLGEFEALEDNSNPQELGKRAQVDATFTVIEEKETSL